MSIDNNGGALEGHTPRGFAGMGTGLFVGDDVNPGFPEGDGVQAYLTFGLPGRTVVGRATLSSNSMTLRGEPFRDLGSLLVERVVYDQFSPALFDLGAESDLLTCSRTGDTGISCDVSSFVEEAVGAGADRIQLRLLFEDAGDGDGEPDLALFFLTDANTNEAGIFTLTLED